MIDAQAVSTHLETLEALTTGEQGPQGIAQWLRESAGQLPAEHQRDAAGNHWLTLRGANSRSVVLGSHLYLTPGSTKLDSLFSLVTGLETLKALNHRFEAKLPCTVQLAIWTKPDSPASTDGAQTIAGLEKAAAYLEVHLESGTTLQDAGAPLGVATSPSGAEPVTFHPNLSALCDEAIRELTGTSATVPAESAPHATEMTRQGIPTAILYVQHATEAAPHEPSRTTRLHLLQAAEAFGRWAEATVHAVAGDQTDLWAREQRIPHTS